MTSSPGCSLVITSASQPRPLAAFLFHHRRHPHPYRDATRGRFRFPLYLALHERADVVDGRARFRKDPRPDLPGVRNSRPYLELDLTSGGAHPLRHTHGVIEEDLVAADLDECRRQPGRVGVK